MTHFRTLIAGLFAFAGILVPSLAFAQTAGQGQSIDKLGTFLQQFIGFIDNYLVPLLFAVAFIVFIFGIFQYFIVGGADEEKRTKGRAFMLWGLIGFFVMVSVWGILNLLVNSFGFGGDTKPPLPTFGSPSSGAPASSGNNAFPTAPAQPADKCANVSCAAGTACSPFTGKCDLTAV